jgi:hypothetical protein
MGKTKASDNETTPARAEQPSHSDQSLVEERRKMIREYANYLREILKRLRKRLN